MDEQTGTHEDNVAQMSHQEALDIEAVAQYLLNDLSPEHRLRFEEHYFECEACARAVGAGQVFVRGIRPLPEPWWRRMAFPVLTPITVALVALIVVQNVSTIPSLRTQLTEHIALQPNTVIMAYPAERGVAESETVNTNSITVELNLPPDAASPYYRVELQGQKTSMSQVVPAPTGSRISLHVAKEALGAGSFNVVVYGLSTPNANDGKQLQRYYFKIQ